MIPTSLKLKCQNTKTNLFLAIAINLGVANPSKEIDLEPNVSDTRMVRPKLTTLAPGRENVWN